MSRFTSRKFLLAFIAQLAGLAALFFPAHEGEIANAAQQIGGLLAMALSAFGYVKGEAEIDAARVQGEQQIAAVKESAKLHQQAAMGRAVLIVLLLIPALAMTGCKTSPGGYKTDSAVGQYDTAQETFIQTVKTLTVGRQVGVFDDAEWSKIVALIKQGDSILDEMEAAALADQATVQSLYLETFQSLLRRLVVWSVQVSNKEVSVEPSTGSDSRTSGLVGPGTRHAGDEGERAGARPEVPGRTEGTPQAAGGTGHLHRAWHAAGRRYDRTNSAGPQTAYAAAGRSAAAVLAASG